jgi:hypothetical protein
MRLTAFIEYCAIAIGIISILADRYLAFPKGVELGGCLIGIGFLLAGLEAILTRQMSLRFSDYGWDDWMGAPSVIVGMMQLLTGLALIGCAYAQYAGQWLNVVNFLSARPGPVMAAAGLMLLGLGMVVIIMADRYGGKLRFIFVGGPQMVVGAVLMTLGVASLSAGTWEWFHRPSFERFAQSTAKKLNLPTPVKAWRNTVSALK